MLYSKQVLDHFQNPRNQGKISNPEATSQVRNHICGDIMKIYLKIMLLQIQKNFLKNCMKK